MNSEVRIIPLIGLPDITPGTDLSGAIVDCAAAQEFSFERGDILVVTSKIVSKAEGQLVDLRTVAPSALAGEVAKAQEKDPRLVEVVLREAKRIVKMAQKTLIVETRHGLVCANAGVDESNIAGDDIVALLPKDADRSAFELAENLRQRTGIGLPVIISDTFGRPWREGVVDVAIGVAGLRPLRDYRGVADTEGHVLKMTVLAVADELASAAELVMGKLNRTPVAVIRGYPYEEGAGAASEIVRAPEKDLFR